MTEAEATLRKLHWRCRRGLLELDLVFSRFLQERYSSLDQNDKTAFHRLLELQDQTLLGYINGEQEPTDPDLSAIVRKLRH